MLAAQWDPEIQLPNSLHQCWDFMLPRLGWFYVSLEDWTRVFRLVSKYFPYWAIPQLLPAETSFSKKCHSHRTKDKYIFWMLPFKKLTIVHDSDLLKAESSNLEFTKCYLGYETRWLATLSHSGYTVKTFRREPSSQPCWEEIGQQFSVLPFLHLRGPRWGGSCAMLCCEVFYGQLSSGIQTTPAPFAFSMLWR